MAQQSEGQAVEQIGRDMRYTPPQERAWYVVQTAPKSEQRVADGLELRGLTTYVPKATKWVFPRHRKSRNRRREKVSPPRFPRYVFVDIQGRLAWDAIHETPGVTGVICMGLTPVRLPRTVIEDLMAAEDMGMFDETTGPIEALIGADVVLMSGPLEGYQAVVTAPPRAGDPEARLTVELPLFGRRQPVVVSLDKIRVLA